MDPAPFFGDSLGSVKKKLRLAAPFIVTMSSVAGIACSKEPPPETVHANPPGPDPTVPPPASAAPTTVASFGAAPSGTTPPNVPTHTMNPPPPRTLNAEINGETVFKSGGKCKAGKKAVTCPATMASPAWDQCDGGTIRQMMGTCQCQISGANAPAPKTVDCP